MGRILPISHPIAEALARRRARRDPDSLLVFHRDGIPGRRWRTAWRSSDAVAISVDGTPAQLRTSFTNADSARNVGLEIEARRNFAEFFTVGANYTYVDSKITLTPAAAQVQTLLKRPLAGQSKNLFNAMFEAGTAATSVRVLYNFFGDRISDVGSLGLPDIIEDQHGSLDLVVSSRWRQLNVRVSAENLTNEEFDLTQGRRLQRRYQLGRTMQVSLPVDRLVFVDESGVHAAMSLSQGSASTRPVPQCPHATRRGA